MQHTKMKENTVQRNVGKHSTKTQCFLVLVSGIFMPEFSCVVSIAGNHLNHGGTTGQKKIKELFKGIYLETSVFLVILHLL